MRVLKNDFVKYAHDEEAAEDQEETGWKYIHGDVFRFPKYKSLFAAALGSGTQLFTLTVFIFILALVGVFYPYNRGALFTALVVIYALTSGIAGYTATSFYCQLEGSNWVRNLLLTGCLFCGPLFLTFCFLNTVAIAYTATAALPFGTIVVIVLIWTLVTSPLLVLGGIAGKNSKAEFQAPVRTTKYPREIPPLPWYRATIPQMAMAGFLPFSAIYIELYYIFASVWGHRIYTIYSILFIVFIILLIVTAFITVALTYFQLAAEDHEWWWRGWRPSYRNVLLTVRKELNIPCSSKLSTEDLEAEIFLHLLRDYSRHVFYIEESGNFEGLLEFSEPSDGQHSLQFGLSQWTVQALSALKGGRIFTLAKIYQLLARKLSGKVFLEAANYQLKRDFVRKGGHLAAINLESGAALLAVKQGVAGATSRYLGLRSMMALLGPVLRGTFLADVVIQMLGTDYARILRAIYAFAQVLIFPPSGRFDTLSKH
ncbi:hypothetical protein C1H46_044693 [Malus baccata]|uniref:Transmembrane 9 superfamily member n=1 Tax=Malus baccata TaxID=106549 RepID=A0A540K6D1_MALBA|nr:hypothetical protein C1H46_044693 [Malus baccata]